MPPLTSRHARPQRRSPDFWPAMYYLYGVWGYALQEARTRATDQSNRRGEPVKMYLYRAMLDGTPVWVVSWDPKKREA